MQGWIGYVRVVFLYHPDIAWVLFIPLPSIPISMNIISFDGTRGFSKDQLKGKQLLPTFLPDALVVFRANIKFSCLQDFSPEDN